jgi:TPR repeat protein
VRIAIYTVAILCGMSIPAKAQESIAPCSVEQYVPPPPSQVEALRQNLADDVRVAFQAGNKPLFLGLLCRGAAAKLVDAEFSLGLILFKGYGFMEQDERQSRVWLRRAAAQGHPQAQYLLGDMYIRGAGGPVHGAEGVRLLRSAADANVPMALVKLAQEHILGRNVEHDLPKARQLLERAKQLGFHDAQPIIDLLDQNMSKVR